MRKSLWMSYDLGVNGDYEGLYSWLDDHDAKECGDSVAYFQFSYDGDLFESLKSSISEAITVNRRARIYVVYRDQDQAKVKGRFIFGRRKGAPWEGFGTNAAHDGADTDEQAS